MTPLPKKKHSRARSAQRRRGSNKQTLPNLVKCKSCGQLKRSHTICKNCGSY